MYQSKLRSQSKSKSRNKNKSMEFINDPAVKRQTLECTPKSARLTNIAPGHSQNIDSPFKLVQIIDKRFEKLGDQLQSTIRSMFHEYEERVLNEIDKRLNVMKSDLVSLTERVVSLETRVSGIGNNDSAKVIDITEETEELRREIKQLKDVARKHENNAVANDIRIVGVPERQNENLLELFSKICQTVNISPPEIKNAFRVRSKKKNSQRSSASADNSASIDSPIIVKFQSPYERNYVLRSITSHIKASKDILRLKILGFDSLVPFYVNENLTPNNHRIFLLARRLKKQKLVFSSFINRGSVYIRKYEHGEPIRIDDPNALITFRENSNMLDSN